MRRFKQRADRGVTLTELLVVMAIIGMLATMAVPVVVNRSTQAKFGVARAEVRTLGAAEEMVGSIHGIYVPLQMLDNIPPNTSFDATRDDTVDNIPAGWFGIWTDISAEDQDANIIPQLDLSNSADSRVENLYLTWEGPFVNFQRVYVQGLVPGGPPPIPNSLLVQLDYPVDPWGQPYRLYSPLGITGNSIGTSGTTPATNADFDNIGFSNGRIGTTDDRFDRYAVVSFGPDGLSDGTQIITGSTSSLTPALGNDIIYFFGTNPRELNTGFGGVVIVTPTP